MTDDVFAGAAGRRAFLALTAMGAMAATASQADAQPSRTAARPPQDALRAIEQSNTAFVTALKAGDIPGLVAPYGDGVAYVAADGSGVTGRASIERMFAARFQAIRVTDASVRSDGAVSVAPDLIFEWGEASIAATTQAGLAVNRTSPYLNAWKKASADAPWKIVRSLNF